MDLPNAAVADVITYLLVSQVPTPGLEIVPDPHRMNSALEAGFYTSIIQGTVGSCLSFSLRS